MAESAANRSGQVLATGFFDGVHLGHRKILDGADSVLTFSNHPLSVLFPEKSPLLLMSQSERMTELSKDGRSVLAFEFTPEFAMMPPGDFISFIRTRIPGLRKVRCGANWTFGAGGRGTPDTMRSCGIEVEVVPYAEYEGEIVSSTRIRSALAEGDIENANAMLGGAYSFTGKISPGKGVGGVIGFPTLNLHPDKPIGLPFGVYAVRTPLGIAAANWGNAPTMGKRAWKEPVFELHLLDEPGSADTLPLSEFKTEILKFVRFERKFPSVECLARQIAEDVDTVKMCFSRK